MEAVGSAMEETMASARGSRLGLLGEALDWCSRAGFEGVDWITFVVSAWIAFWDFLVPKVRPRVFLAERTWGC